VLNEADLDFKVSRERLKTIRTDNGTFEVPVNDGDILMGAGFGLRTIVLGFPLRYDVGWPYYRNGFGNDPIHYISIGVDF
jgi:hypothetical protein